MITPQNPGAPSDEEDRQRAILEWRRRTAAEYASAAKAARMSHLLIALGADRGLIDLALRVTRDELDHAELSQAVAQALGDTADPSPVEVEALLGPADPRPLMAAVLLVLEDFCIGETLAVPLFQAMRAGADQPEAVAALTRIIRDEAAHRAFAWRCLDALLALDPAGVRAAVEALLPEALQRFADSYGAVPLTLVVGPLARGAGLLDGASWRRIFWRALDDDVQPRFLARGWAILTPPRPDVVA